LSNVEWSRHTLLLAIERAAGNRFAPMPITRALHEG